MCKLNFHAINLLIFLKSVQACKEQDINPLRMTILPLVFSINYSRYTENELG